MRSPWWLISANAGDTVLISGPRRSHGSEQLSHTTEAVLKRQRWQLLRPAHLGPVLLNKRGRVLQLKVAPAHHN